jgi:DNA-binding NarL/FixJ family response regulator
LSTVRILVATDADWVLNDIKAAMSEPDTTFIVCRSGKVVATAVELHQPDVAVLDMQIGTMGGVAVTMDMRLDASVGRAPEVPVLILLDRKADVHLARRAGANGWMVKPLDALRIRTAITSVASGGCYAEGLPAAAEAITETPEEVSA